jgi:hypothetical protein
MCLGMAIGERKDAHPSMLVSRVAKALTVLPLPRGEGWGEGKFCLT